MRVLLALALLASAVPAAAQNSQASSPEARRAIHDFGRCAADRSPSEAKRVLKMDFTSSRYRTGLRLLADDAERSCASDSFGQGVLKSASVLFAGAIAETLIESNATPVNVQLLRAATAKSQTFSPTDAIALCVARSMPDQIAALYATEPGSDEETKAAAPLSAAVAPCARKAGVTTVYDLSPAALRAMTATAAYRLIAKFEAGHA